MLVSEPSISFSRMGREIASPVIVDLMAQALANPDLLSLAAGFTDNVALPRGLVGRFAAELTVDGLRDEPLQYGQNQGRVRLRELTCGVIAMHPNEKSDIFDPQHLFITNGSQQALYLAIQAICDPGDIVLVEEPSYFVCLEMLKGLGLRPVGIPCDDSGGVIPEGFAEKLAELDAAGERPRVKAIYLVSYFCNPSSRSLGVEEKRAISKILHDAGFIIPVIEDAAYRELYFDTPHPAPSIISMPEFDGFPKLYLGTYTKPFATGLKIGFGYCNHEAWRSKILCIKGHQDFGSAHFTQAIIERVLEEGLYSEHLAGIQKHYKRKAAILNGALVEGGLRSAGWQWAEPRGGLILWLRGPEELDLRAKSSFYQGCIDQGVLYVPGDLCFPDGKGWNCARLSSGALPEENLREAASRFVAQAVLKHDTSEAGR